MSDPIITSNQLTFKLSDTVAVADFTFDVFVRPQYTAIYFFYQFR